MLLRGQCHEASCLKAFTVQSHRDISVRETRRKLYIQHRVNQASGFYAKGPSEVSESCCLSPNSLCACSSWDEVSGNKTSPFHMDHIVRTQLARYAIRRKTKRPVASTRKAAESIVFASCMRAVSKVTMGNTIAHQVLNRSALRHIYELSSNGVILPRTVCIWVFL